MKYIEKGKEPTAWKTRRLTPGAAFSAIPELQKALLKEQGYLCCYCMSRIGINNMIVEHWKPRRYKKLIFKYSNLMAACEGNSCGEHCDKLKKDQEILLNPTDKSNNVETIIKYSWSTGAIEVDERYQNDIDTFLNLNNAILREKRKETLDGLMKVLSSKRIYTESEFKKHLKRFKERDPDGQFHPHCMILIKFLEKKLRQFK